MYFYVEKVFVLFWVVAGVFLLFWFAARRHKRIAHLFAKPDALAKISLEVSGAKRFIHVVLIVIALSLLIVSLARPQWGEHEVKVTRRGVDILFMVDTSLSMLAEDVKPSRIAATQQEIRVFLEQFKGDRIGLLAFAGSSFLQVPLTLDYSAFELFLDALGVGLIPDPGTSLARAVETARAAFDDEAKEHKVIVLLSDGENHEGDPKALAKFLKREGIRLYALGVGTEDGGPIPLRGEGGTLGGLKKDTGGQTVITRLDAAFLRTLATETGGLYYPLTGSQKEVKLMYDDIQLIEKRDLKEGTHVQREDRYQWFLGAAFILLMFEFLLNERRGAWL